MNQSAQIKKLRDSTRALPGKSGGRMFQPDAFLSTANGTWTPWVGIVNSKGIRVDCGELILDNPVDFTICANVAQELAAARINPSKMKKAGRQAELEEMIADLFEVQHDLLKG